MGTRSYLCIDLKSFYASVECVERCLDALTTNLVVADPERGRRDDLSGGLAFPEGAGGEEPLPGL